ncbi:MAG: BtrH N-terminal domain-containing protein [Treponema sp.]|jgi:hypothetical protein|nr:BtrH N-terminal domain-containing protein [Treponema sp.]
MWNGIEDIYINKTKENIPDQFFFAMSGFCGFAYIKTNKADTKRIVSFGDGRTKKMYKFLSPIVGFDYHFIESKTPELALKKAKKEIDCGYPIVIGAFDMYYLEYYPKLYHKDHIPFHYFLMVGYDDELEKIYVFDCGRKERLELSYANLLLGMGAEYNGLSKQNTICTIRMDNPNCKKHIVKTALEYKASLFINPPTSFLGINGMKKLAKELPDWENELGKEETIKTIKNMITFFGSVPVTPNKLLGIKKKDDVVFMCSREKMSKLLNDLGIEYKNNQFKKAGDFFYKSGQEFEKLCNVFVDYILGISDYKDKASKIVLNIADLEYDAFKLVLDGIYSFGK